MQSILREVNQKFVNSRSIRVLIVEDREEDFLYFSFLLQRNASATYVVEWAANYQAGLAAIARREHDVALFDYQLGSHTGLDLLRETVNMGSEMPVILLTGHDNPEIDRDALENGAADYLCKVGLSATQLERSIRYSLRQSAMLSLVRRGQQQLDLFMRNVPCAMSIQGPQGEFLFKNDRFETQFDGAAVSTPENFNVSEESRPHFDGHRHWLVNSFPMLDGSGRLLRGTAAIDISERVSAEEELKRTTDVLTGILASLPVMATRLSADGHVLECRGRGLADVGLSEEQVVGTPITELFPGSYDQIQEVLDGGEANFVGEIIHRDQSHFYDNYFRFDDVKGEGAIGFSVNVTERKWLERRLLSISDAEQQRIGADLHDGLGQHLTGIACLAAALRDRLAPSSNEANQAATIVTLVNDAIAQCRALSRGLCPVQLEHTGLISALEDLTFQVQLISGVTCRFEAVGAPPNCSHDAAMHIYRITQEAINNAIRHGSAQSVNVSLISTDTESRVVIEDNGSGFDMDAERTEPGVGLRLMNYRAGIIGGTFSVAPRSGGGVSVACTFPKDLSTHENTK